MGSHHWGHCAEDEEKRRKWQDPEAILAAIGLKKDDTFVDVGCGAGYFSIPAAKIVGLSGKVYGVDITPEMIARLKDKARTAGIDNLELKVASAEETIFCNPF